MWPNTIPPFQQYHQGFMPQGSVPEMTNVNVPNVEQNPDPSITPIDQSILDTKFFKDTLESKLGGDIFSFFKVLTK